LPTLTRAEASERLLARKTNRKKNEFLIGAWAVATVEKLIAEGVTATKAKSRVAKAAGVSDSTIEWWYRNWLLDNAPLAPRKRGLDPDHFQRLSYRVKVIFRYLRNRNITGDMMCRYINEKPDLVHWFSARRNVIKTSRKGGPGGGVPDHRHELRLHWIRRG
jgi:hypothetical protein